MTRYLTIAAIALLAALCQPAQADPTFTTRHAEHLAGSALIAGVATDLTGSELEGFSISLAIGLAKEGIDQTQYPRAGCTWKSIIADAIGSAIGAELGGLYLERQQHGFRVAYAASF